MGDPKRCTGRTTRMLAEARRLCDAGRAVYVVFHSRQECKRHETAENSGLRFETLDSLRTLDYRSGRLAGAHPNCIVLVDHYAVEERFRWLVEQATRFDAPAERPTDEVSDG